MTLVFNEPQEGPATHALIIGVEHPSPVESGPFSAAVTAHAIADLLVGLDFDGAPLASVDLIASYSPFTKSNYQSPRDGINYSPDRPDTWSVARAIDLWRTRLRAYPPSLGFFYYAGPAAEDSFPLMLLIPGERPGIAGLEFGKLWRRMAYAGPGRQLFFIDGCPLRTNRPEGSVMDLPPAGAGGMADAPSALFRASLPGIAAKAQGSEATPLAAALREIFSSERVIGAAALGEALSQAWRERVVEAGIEIVRPFEWDAEVNFPIGVRPRAAAAAGAAAAERKPEPAVKQKEPPRKKAGKAAQKKAAQSEADRLAHDLVFVNPRARECLRLVEQGLSSAEIARRLGIAPTTVDNHIRAALKTLGLRDRQAAARLLVESEGGRAPAPVQAAATEPREPNTHFVSDDPEVERDDLRRGPLAIALGRRLHRIWCRSNGIRVPGGEEADAGGDDRSAFVLHLDAPWGGGKTSFANFLARVLNPFPRGATEPARFLHDRAGGAVGTIFIVDPPAGGGEGGDAAEWPEEARRPWIIVPFNAWQAEHCTPPWWTFYQAIRKGCFEAVWAEGREASRPAQGSAPPAPLIEERLWSWASLWRRELWWRLRNPKVLVRLATFAIAALALLILWQADVVFRGDEGPDFNAGNALGFLLAGIGGISGLWGLGALLTESVAPGTDDAAERRSLGNGDPFERFRRHFQSTIAAVRRPVMVIVDDLDRCRPDFVVDLVRGIQTLLRSPRVVFVILGDRDWIERAFEAHHAAMSKVNVGPEQDFGARFVEKAIQMSFILPEMPDASQDAYVRRVLIGPGAEAADEAAPPPSEIARQLRADYRERVGVAATPAARKQVEQELAEQYRPLLEAEAAGAVPAAGAAPPKPGAVAKAQADKVLSEERALLAAVDEKMGTALLHRLEPLARFFPPNPRQIKRIVNAITMYTAVAYLQMGIDESDERGIELAVWVIIMTEWPRTWRVLASLPQLADLLAEKDPKAALAGIDESLLPGSREATLKEVNRIRADPDLMALITEEGEGRPRLRSSSVEDFVRLTPLYSRKQRLPEEEKAANREARHGTIVP